MGGSFQCVFISLRLKELITDGLEKKHKDWRNHSEVQSLSAPKWINEILFLDVWRSSVSFSVLFKLLREEKRLKRVSLITSSWWSTRWVTAHCLFIQIRPEGDSNQQQWLWLRLTTRCNHQLWFGQSGAGMLFCFFYGRTSNGLSWTSMSSFHNLWRPPAARWGGAHLLRVLSAATTHLATN